MIDLDDPSAWARAFGLADAPVFGDEEHSQAARHRVLLDGGSGTFMLSVADLPDASEGASWAWSSDVTHHVGIGSDYVTVLRWDQAGPARRFTRRSVAAQLETFYTFLLNDRLERGRGVVRHVIELFRSVRAAVHAIGGPDDASLGAFLLALDDLTRPRGSGSARAIPLAPDDPARALYSTLVQGRLSVELERFSRAHVGARALDLHAGLSIRHAGGLIFQEAHFELLRPPSLDLLGNADGGKSSPSRGGAHFTPPAIARSIVEHALTSVDGLDSKTDLVVLDPACGSGAFLHEALRALRRRGFSGRIRVVGRDISQAAISMARFVLDRALVDWSQHKVSLDLEVGDSLAGALPLADVVVMNPPFMAFAALSSTQREQMREILGKAYQGRPDLSMSFITHALAALKPGGALGCLFPASLLSLTSAAQWRQDLLERAGLRMLASIGDFGLFEYALVQVAGAVFVNGPADRQVLTVWTDNDAGATGSALRHLRKLQMGGTTAEDQKTWRIGRLPVSRLAAQPDWRLRAPRLELLLQELAETVPTTVGDLFKVQQGIRTGDNAVFLLSKEVWQELPPPERRYFRRAITNASVREGQLEPSEYVFYPYKRGELTLRTADELSAAVPTYFERYLKPNEARLSGRSTVAKRGKPWWTLAEHRNFETGGKARVISKYFGGVGGFAVDLGSDAAVVQGYSWYPLSKLAKAASSASSQVGDSVSPGFVQAYGALFNTHIFAALLAAYSAPVAGGQYDLSKRYVDLVNLPDLALLFADSSSKADVLELEKLGSNIRTTDAAWVTAANMAAAKVYRVDASALIVVDRAAA